MQVENEDLIFTLETLVERFDEEMAPYAVGLTQHLAAAFWRMQVRLRNSSVCMNSFICSLAHLLAHPSIHPSIFCKLQHCLLFYLHILNMVLHAPFCACAWSLLVLAGLCMLCQDHPSCPWHAKS